jgi:serine/threonine protein kinase
MTGWTFQYFTLLFAILVFLKYAIPAYSCFFVVLKACFPQPSGDSDSTDNDEKGSLPYMAPEIFEKRCRQNKHSNSVTPSALVATTPFCATPTRTAATTPHAASTPMAPSLKEQDALKNKHRDIWAFGCVLYELATHRRPWYQKMESTSSFSESHPADLKLPQTHQDPYLQPDPYLFFLRTFWRKLGKFHGGCSVC